MTAFMVMKLIAIMTIAMIINLLKNGKVVAHIKAEDLTMPKLLELLELGYTISGSAKSKPFNNK